MIPMSELSPDYFTKPVADVDPEIAEVLTNEAQRQESTLEMIASENFVPQAILDCQGSVLTNKYAEGYPGKRYYSGCEHVDVEPGARLVFTCGSTVSPFSTAFLASSPAPIITDGFEVLVQLVIEAITAEPCLSVASWPSRLTFTPPLGSASGAPGLGSPPAVGSGSPSPVTPAASAGVSLAGKDSMSCEL